MTVAGRADGDLGKLTSVEKAYRHIRDAIIAGEYPPNTPLRLQRIATEAGVSVIPVREALRTLEGERLVQTVPNRGAVVAAVSLEDARDAYQMRLMLEVEAVKRSCGKLSDEEIEHLKQLAAMQQKRDQHDGRAAETHRELHFAMYAYCGSPWLIRFISTIWDHTERYRQVGRPLSRVTSEHLAIIEALKEDNREAAGRVLREHLTNTLEAIENSPFIETVNDAGKPD